MNNFKPIFGQLNRETANFHHAFLELEQTIHDIRHIGRREELFKSNLPESRMDAMSLKCFREHAPELIHKFEVLASYLFGNEYKL
jgi:hypothetical protein